MYTKWRRLFIYSLQWEYLHLRRRILGIGTSLIGCTTQLSTIAFERIQIFYIFKAMVTISSWDRPINIYRIILWAKIETRWWGSRHGHSWFAWKTMLGWINLRAHGLNYISNHIHTLGAGDRENRVTELIQKHVIARNDRLHERIMWHAFSCNNAFFFSSFFPFVSLPSRPPSLWCLPNWVELKTRYRANQAFQDAKVD